jgi:ribose transport system ATP-binding protein
VNGRDVVVSDPRAATRHGLALVTEDRKAKGLLLASSITDNIVLPSLRSMARFGTRQFQRETELAERYQRDLAIRCTSVGQASGALSGGNQQKVVIAKWLATSPQILLLDEPTRGIDAAAKQEIYQLIFALAERGLAIVVVSSELPELIALSDRVLVMCEGRQTGILEHDEATETRIMDLASPGGRHNVADADPVVTATMTSLVETHV